MTITPSAGGYVVSQGKYITYAPTRSVGIARLLVWLEIDSSSMDYPLGSMIEPYDIECEKRLCR